MDGQFFDGVRQPTTVKLILQAAIAAAGHPAEIHPVLTFLVAVGKDALVETTVACAGSVFA